MSHMPEQDWTPVVIKKKVAPKAQINFNPGHKKELNLVSDDPDPPKTLGKEKGQQIQQARCLKKLSQADLAKKIAVQANVIKDYENGNVIPNKKILRLICGQLNIKINV
jgi:ribosome-binding protein aMBF1 (putative translation factor)